MHRGENPVVFAISAAGLLTAAFFKFFT